MNVRKELSDANAKLKNVANAAALEAEQRANQKVVHAARQSEERYSDRMRIVDETVDYETTNGGFQEGRTSGDPGHVGECNRQEEQIAEFNGQLRTG